MTGEPGVDYPEAKTPVDVLTESRSQTLLSFVEHVGDQEIILSLGQDHRRRPVRLQPGERLELVWRGPTELRAVTAELVAVESSGKPVWRVRTVGRAGRGQRRASVRAPMRCRVALPVAGQTLEGTTLDLSEGGAHCLFSGSVGGPAEPGDLEGGADTAVDGASPAEPDAADTAADATIGDGLDTGTVHHVTVWLDDEQITTQAEIVRRYRRPDRRVEISLRFIGLPERTQDLIRAQVFACLRELRAKGVI